MAFPRTLLGSSSIFSRANSCTLNLGFLNGSLLWWIWTWRVPTKSSSSWKTAKFKWNFVDYLRPQKNPPHHVAEYRQCLYILLGLVMFRARSSTEQSNDPLKLDLFRRWFGFHIWFKAQKLGTNPQSFVIFVRCFNQQKIGRPSSAGTQPVDRCFPSGFRANCSFKVFRRSPAWKLRSILPQWKKPSWFQLIRMDLVIKKPSILVYFCSQVY